MGDINWSMALTIAVGIVLAVAFMSCVTTCATCMS